MEVDRRAFLATLGVGALETMSPEDKAEELEHYMIHMLEEEHAEKEEPLSEDEVAELEEQERTSRRGTGSLFSSMRELEPIPENATLEDFFRLRFAPARHVLQSANHALMTGQPERTILACLLHDTVQNLIKAISRFLRVMDLRLVKSWVFNSDVNCPDSTTSPKVGNH